MTIPQRQTQTYKYTEKYESAEYTHSARQCEYRRTQTRHTKPESTCSVAASPKRINFAFFVFILSESMIIFRNVTYGGTDEEKDDKKKASTDANPNGNIQIRLENRSKKSNPKS